MTGQDFKASSKVNMFLVQVGKLAGGGRMIHSRNPILFAVFCGASMMIRQTIVEKNKKAFARIPRTSYIYFSETNFNNESNI